MVCVLGVQVRAEQHSGELHHCLSVLHLGSGEVSVVLIGGVCPHLLEGESFFHSVVVVEHTQSGCHLLGARIVEDTELLGKDRVLGEVSTECESSCVLVDDACCFLLLLAGLERCFILELLLFLSHLCQHLVQIYAEVRPLDVDCVLIQISEGPCVELQDFLPGQEVTLALLAVANLLFNAERVVSGSYDVLIRR